MKWCSFRRNAFALAMPPHLRPFSPRGTGGEGGIEKREGVLAVSHRTAWTSPTVTEGSVNWEERGVLAFSHCSAGASPTETEI